MLLEVCGNCYGYVLQKKGIKLSVNILQTTIKPDFING